MWIITIQTQTETKSGLFSCIADLVKGNDFLQQQWIFYISISENENNN